MKKKYDFASTRHRFVKKNSYFLKTFKSKFLSINIQLSNIRVNQILENNDKNKSRIVKLHKTLNNFNRFIFKIVRKFFLLKNKLFVTSSRKIRAKNVTIMNFSIISLKNVQTKNSKFNNSIKKSKKNHRYIRRKNENAFN